MPEVEVLAFTGTTRNSEQLLGEENDLKLLQKRLYLCQENECVPKDIDTHIFFPVFLIISSNYKIRKGVLHQGYFFAVCYFTTIFLPPWM